MWHLSYRADPRAREIADRHYSRQKPGTPQFTPPGRVLILVTPEYNALWATSFPFPQYVHRAWPEFWTCCLFRNESNGQYLSSELVSQAVAATRWRYGDVTPGMVTFIDRSKVIHKRDFGRCFRKAGFVTCGETKSGLLALMLKLEDMPVAAAPIQ